MMRLHLTLLLGLAVVACGDEGKRPLGASCEGDDQCVSGLCAAGQCLDPDADTDLDGLTNGIEAALGTSPLNADSDYDDVRDGAEVATDITNIDSDGDGIADALESLTRDSDGDCVVDQLDAGDTELSVMRALACGTVGVCDDAAVTLSCDAGVITCGFAAVPNWEADETTCDGRDNDCDGRTDEGSADSDGDGIADCVDDDRDNDSVVSASDNCPEVANASQQDADGDGIGDACDAPGAISISGFEPASPAASTTPSAVGSGEPQLTLAFFSDATCTTAIGEGQIDAAGRFAIALTVAADATTDLYVRATNRAGLSTECRQSFASYVNDSTAPAPVVLATPVASPTASTFALLTLDPPDEAVRVELYRRSTALNPRAIEGDCTGAPWQTVALEPGQDYTTAIALVPNRTNQVSVKVIDRAGNSSGCELLTTIVHDDEAPQIAALSPATVGALDGPQSGPATFAVAGCAEADSTITLYSNDSCSGPVATLDTESDVAGCDEPGVGGWTAELSVAANATTSFWMEVVDLAGNSSGCVALGSYTHDDTAPAAPVATSIRGTSWGVGVATFAVEGAGEVDGMVELFGDAACANALGEGVVEADARWHADITAFAATPTLYGRQVDSAGNAGVCGVLGEMFGPVSFVMTSRGQPRAEDAIVISAPDGSPLAEVVTDEGGVAEATIVAGCGATTVTRYTYWGERGWTSVLGLEPGQEVTFDVDDGNTDISPSTGYYLPIEVPKPPEGAAYYRLATACGATTAGSQDESGQLGTSFQTWFDPACSAEADMTIVVEAMSNDGRPLGYVLAMHVPYAVGDILPVVLAGPWRSDYTAFTVQVGPGKSPTPFELSFRLSHKSEVLYDFWTQAESAFAAPGGTTGVTGRFPNVEHAQVGWRVATQHLGADGTGVREYTELGGYVPGSDWIELEDSLLPRLWSTELAQDDNAKWRFAWTSDPGLAAATDAFAVDLYASGGNMSVSWRIIGRPSDDTSFGLPVITTLSGAEAFGPEAYVSLEGATWFDWATVSDFGTWVDACSGVDLATCVRGLAETITRTTSMQRRGDRG